MKNLAHAPWTAIWLWLVLPNCPAQQTAPLPAPQRESLTKYNFEQTHMGMPFKLTLYASQEQTANAAAKAAFARIAQLDAILSDYQPESELSRLARTSGSGQAVQLSADLWTVLAAAQELASRSEGAFDVTVGPLVRQWRRARRMKMLPEPEDLAAARKSVGYRFLQLDTAKRTALLTQAEMRLDLGGIAVGYALDEALNVLKAQGISQALLDGSGDILTGDAPPNAQGWRIALDPRGTESAGTVRYVELANASITTSGDAFQHVEINGQRYSHIVDPRTGLGLTDRSSVVVIAPTGIAADSLATAVSVLGPAKGLELIEGTPRAAAFIVRADPASASFQPERFESRRLKEYLLRPR